MVDHFAELLIEDQQRIIGRFGREMTNEQLSALQRFWSLLLMNFE
jgi:hypothetical protein